MLPFVILYFLRRLAADRAYRKNFRERLGILKQPFPPRTPAESIWLHAVSVGEVASAVPLIRSLKQHLAEAPVFLSVGTVAGRSVAERVASNLVDGIFYAPIDYVSCVRRVIKKIRPSLVIVLETEIWPNHYAEVKRCGASLAIANARISPRTYPRYTRFRWFFRQVLRFPDRVFVQSEADRERYTALGVRIARTMNSGNLKYDAAVRLPPSEVDLFDAHPIWIAASTVGPNERGSYRRHDVDEDDIAIRIFGKLRERFPKLLLVLAPRQPARFEEVARKLDSSGIPFLRFTTIKKNPGLALSDGGVLLLDAVGELFGLYRRANAAFVGGSLAPRGGHNILEPAAAECPIVVGPHMQNFQAIADDFLRAEALIQVQDEQGLLSALEQMLSDPARAAELGQRGKRVFEEQRGSASRVAAELTPLYYLAQRRCELGLVARLPSSALAFLWIKGGEWKRRRGEQHALSLPKLQVPVVSIGGITIGGSGKTPFTTYLAARLKKAGHSPAILSRGYGRRSSAEALVLAPGTQLPSAVTGDEAQIFLRSSAAPVGISASRYDAGRLLLREFPHTNICLLDDGFQHARLCRDCDIVVIDGLDPFGGGEVVPLGRLREPLEALTRADVFVVTRAENDDRFQAIAHELGRWNGRAPVYRTKLLARSWRDAATGRSLGTLRGRRVGAFCGLGNPENFWQTLNSLGLDVVFKWPFPDHHPYKPIELNRVALQARLHGAELLVTTEKDVINRPLQLETAIAPLDLAWLEIDFELENESDFIRHLERTVNLR